MNRQFFGGIPVFYSTPSGNIFVNVSTLPPLVHQPQQVVYSQQPINGQQPVTYGQPQQPIQGQVYNPQYAPQPVAYGQPQQPIQGQVYNPQYAQSPQYGQAPPPPQPYPVPVATATPLPSQTGQYIVPPDVSPGSQVHVTTPNGSIVMLTIPKEATPGSVLQYNY